jgi:hypothetical protein
MIVRIALFALVLALTSRTAAQEPEPTSADEAEEPVYPIDLAFADVSDPNPGSGFGQILAGWIALGIGTAGVVQAPLCKYNDYDTGWRSRRCRNWGIGVGVVGLALGIPWLTFGYQKRRAQRAWKQRHRLMKLPELNVGFDRDSMTLGFRF